jgi:hypothetical protein
MPSPILTEDRFHTAHYIVSESHGYRSREQVVIASGAGELKPGAVLGRITSSGKYTELDPDGADGSEAAAAILYEGCDATSSDVRRTVTARDTEVHAAVLVWPTGITDNERNTALGELADLGITPR